MISRSSTWINGMIAVAILGILAAVTVPRFLNKGNPTRANEFASKILGFKDVKVLRTRYIYDSWYDSWGTGCREGITHDITAQNANGETISFSVCEHVGTGVMTLRK